jgi:hypothetical protein
MNSFSTCVHSWQIVKVDLAVALLCYYQKKAKKLLSCCPFDMRDLQRFMDTMPDSSTLDEVQYHRFWSWLRGVEEIIEQV